MQPDNTEADLPMRALLPCDEKLNQLGGIMLFFSKLFREPAALAGPHRCRAMEAWRGYTNTHLRTVDHTIPWLKRGPPSTSTPPYPRSWRQWSRWPTYSTSASVSPPPRFAKPAGETLGSWVVHQACEHEEMLGALMREPVAARCRCLAFLLRGCGFPSVLFLGPGFRDMALGEFDADAGAFGRLSTADPPPPPPEADRGLLRLPGHSGPLVGRGVAVGSVRAR